MNINKISTLYLLQKNRVNKQQKCPIRCRITFQQKRKIFSTGLFINPDHWNSKKQKAHPPNAENDMINSQLSLISQKINKAFLMLQVQENSFDVEDVYNQYLGKKIIRETGLIEMFDIHIKRQEKLIGISTTIVSVAKFYQTRGHVKSFVKHQYNKQEFLLNALKMDFIEGFDYYLRAEKRFKQNTIYKTIQRFRQIVKLAVALNYLDKDPFILFKNSKPKKQLIYLTIEELETIENHKYASARLQQVADMFLFCCYTGLAYAEMNALSREHLVTGFDGNTWIKMSRKKTSNTISIPLLPKTKILLDKLNMISVNDKVLPDISNQKFNSYIKEIANIVGIDKKLTHHTARKTFATTVLLYNDVPMEIVSELLGHSKITITQEHYAKVVQKKVSEHMNKLSEKLK